MPPDLPPDLPPEDKQRNSDGDSFERGMRDARRADPAHGGWRPSVTAVRVGWPDTVVVLSHAHPWGDDYLVQVSQGGDVFWCSIEELFGTEEMPAGGAPDASAPGRVPRVSVSQGECRRDPWPAIEEPSTGQVVGFAAVLLAGMLIGAIVL